MIFQHTVLSWFIRCAMMTVPVAGLSVLSYANESAISRLTINEPTPSVQFGVVNHGRETGVSTQLLFPKNSISYGVSLDKSLDETHTIIGVGKSLSQGYVYGTASYARENHFDTALSAYGASVGGAYLTPWVKLDGNIIAHQGRDKHLDSTVTNSTQTRESITGNIKTITTTHTRTTTERTFVGDVRGYANVGATVNVGQNGELRAGVQHEFGMNDDTHANIQYRHYFNDNRSKAHLYADTNKRYETGIEYAITDAVSMSVVVFSEQYHDDRNHGGMLGFTHRFGVGAGKAPVLRTVDSHNANARMNAELRDVLHTISPHAVKNIDTLGEVRTTQTVEQSVTEHKEILDTPVIFAMPTVVVENGNTIRVTNHGITDVDGLENIQYTLTIAGGTTMVNTTGVFTDLVDGTYTITTSAEVKNGNTGQFLPAINPNNASVTIGVTPTMTQAEFDEIIARLPTSLRDGKAYKQVHIDLNAYLGDDIEITWYQFNFIWGVELPDSHKIVNISQKTISLIPTNDISVYSITLNIQSKTNPTLKTQHKLYLPSVDIFWF